MKPNQLEMLEPLSLAVAGNELHDTIAKLPKERRILVTSHDAFHYFGAAYGLLRFCTTLISGRNMPSSTSPAKRTTARINSGWLRSES